MAFPVLELKVVAINHDLICIIVLYDCRVVFVVGHHYIVVVVKDAYMIVFCHTNMRCFFNSCFLMT